MSVVFNHANLYLIDHRNFISKIYEIVTNSNNTSTVSHENIKSYLLNPKLFCIKFDRTDVNPTAGARKRRHDDKTLEEAIAIKTFYNKLIDLLPTDLKTEIYNKYNVSETTAVRELSRKLFELTKFDFNGITGGNNSDTAMRCEIKENDFLVPAKCRFMCGCVQEQCKKLIGNKYDIIVADPPWWNKYIRRLKNANETMSYSMMYNEDIASIPVKNLLSDNCIIAVWCTNAPSNITAVKDLIFPKWGVEYITTWYWLKLSIDLEPICAFSSGCKKQPYERIIIGKVGDMEVPKDLLLASVPSALHSHKPPLLDLLAPHIKVKEPACLELFARYLLPNTTSVGFEPLKWQHISLYDVT